MRIIVTGSEGFIASHVIRKLITLGHEIIGIDHLDPQVHGIEVDRIRNYEFIDTSAGAVNLATLGPVDVFIHLAAKVGVGQSMYQLTSYVGDNSLDTASMLEHLLARPPKRLVVASSMSIYGEGALQCESGTRGGWPGGTPETHPPDLRSIYALTKYDQEQLCLIWGNANNVPTVALRFFNTYGPGQSLTNPYTGVLAIFATRLLNNKPPIIYEDGQQSRDFIHVDDVANAVVHAALNDIPRGSYNVGTGVATTIQAVAAIMSSILSPKKFIDPIITGHHRKGDIRHCFADTSKIFATGWEPKIPFRTNGLSSYCQWLLTQPIPEDKFDQAQQELVEKGLTK